MSSEIKIFLGVIIGTLVLVFGVSFLLGSGNSQTSSSNTGPVSQDLLIRSDSWKVATDSAKVTIVEFSDFECPSCKAAEPEVESLRVKYAGKINFVYRNFPLPAHQYAFQAAEAAEAAGLQGKFWEMHNKLFELSPELQADNLKQAAKDLGLDVDKFNKDLDSDAVRQKVANDQADGNKASVNATPTFFVNGLPTIGSSGLDSAISSALK